MLGSMVVMALLVLANVLHRCWRLIHMTSLVLWNQVNGTMSLHSITFTASCTNHHTMQYFDGGEIRRGLQKSKLESMNGNGPKESKQKYVVIRN